MNPLGLLLSLGDGFLSGVAPGSTTSVLIEPLPTQSIFRLYVSRTFGLNGHRRERDQPAKRRMEQIRYKEWSKLCWKTRAGSPFHTTHFLSACVGCACIRQTSQINCFQWKKNEQIGVAWPKTH